jgi:hypothetical protein
MKLSCAMGFCALLLVSVSAADAASLPVPAKGEFHCQDKTGSLMYGDCRRLGRGMCSFTAGDGMTVKLPCKDVRHF